MDPISKKYPELSAYQVASDNSIKLIDIDDLEGKDAHTIEINGAALT